MKRVVVGMSGGVDSSLTAWLLKEQGFEVIGLFMKNWEEEPCPAEADYADVVRVCHTLQIPHYSVNFSKEYWDNVFSTCLADYEAGWTPNPDILCNREIKFSLLLEKALDLGAEYLATGHYCRKLSIDGRSCLGRGIDQNKDQSYFLYTLNEKILDKVLFPLGELEKPKVRQMASELSLATAEKKDSTGICFIGKRAFRPFLEKYLPKKPGKMVTTSGVEVGTHQGIAFYTIGQRKGLGIGGPGEPWFVVGKDVAKNLLFVEQGDHPALYSKEAFVEEVSWVNDPPSFPVRCTAKVRYRAPDVPCTVNLQDERLHVEFDRPEKAVTPRQSIVFYQREITLGGGLLMPPPSVS